MNAESTPLTDQQKHELCGILLVGCERATACDYLGVPAADFEAAMARDAAFARDVLRSEARAELRHMTNINKASQDEKNWRTSVWWLERRAQERAETFAAPSRARLMELVETLAAAIVAEVIDIDLQKRVIERLLRIVAGREESPQSHPAESTMLLTHISTNVEEPPSGDTVAHSMPS